MRGTKYLPVILCCAILISSCSCHQEELFRETTTVTLVMLESGSEAEAETREITTEQFQEEPKVVPLTEAETIPVTETETSEAVEKTETETTLKQEVERYPMEFADESCSITIYREWMEDAWVYAAHLKFTDYSRLVTACANGSYNNGCETTSDAAKRLGALFAVNGCYSAPYLNYCVVRNGLVCNGADRNLYVPAVYSSRSGLLLSAWEMGGAVEVVGKNLTWLVEQGLVTDTFCFGPPGLQNGVITDVSLSGARAQRTFIGTNGEPGDIWVCVSDGRYNDGESAGLLGNQCMRYLQSKGCIFGVNLDGGGSSTMYFEGKVLNAAAECERAVVDFLYFK